MANTFKFGNGNWAVKDGYALAYNDENNNFKPLPFDFTRASSATRVNKQGLIETIPSGKPRIDFLDNTSGHLLLEPSRTNLNTFSDPTDAQKGSTSYASVTFQDDFNWGLGSVLENAIVFGDNSTTRYAYYSSTVSSGTVYTLSFFIKMDDNSVPIPATDFLLVLAGTSIASGYNVDNYGNNVYRVSVTGTAGASNTANGILKVASNSSKTFKITGFQVEAGSYATSYIPTEGSSVTRVVELMTQTPPSDIIGQTEGTLYIDFTPNTDEATTKWLAFLGSGSQYIGIYILSNAKIRLEVANTTSQALFDTSFTITKGQRYKCAIAYANNDFTAYVNGTQLGTDTNGSVPATSTIRNYYNTSSIEGTNTNDLKIYDTRLTNTELQNLTS